MAHRPFYFPIDPAGGIIDALKKLDEDLRKKGGTSLLSKKEPIKLFGTEIKPGQVGLVNHGGHPKLLYKPGKYPGFPWRKWVGRTFVGSRALSETVIEVIFLSSRSKATFSHFPTPKFQGLIVVRVFHNQAAVIRDPQNEVFVIKNGGFVAMSIGGSYSILSIIDQTHLSTVVRDKVTNAILGWIEEVKMTRNPGGDGSNREFVVALFLNIPANSCAVLQKGNEFIVKPAGQHCIVEPETTFRNMFTLGENQLEMTTNDMITRDRASVQLTIYLMWQLDEPSKLAKQGYNTPHEALREKTQSILTLVVSHFDYSAIMDNNTDNNTASLSSLHGKATNELKEAFSEYGIGLKDFVIINHQFKGEIAGIIDKGITRALQAKIESVNLSQELPLLQSRLQIAHIQAEMHRKETDEKTYALLANAKAEADVLVTAARAQAEATKLAALAEAEAIRSRASTRAGGR